MGGDPDRPAGPSADAPSARVEVYSSTRGMVTEFVAVVEWPGRRVTVLLARANLLADDGAIAEVSRVAGELLASRVESGGADALLLDLGALGPAVGSNPLLSSRN